MIRWYVTILRKCSSSLIYESLLLLMRHDPNFEHMMPNRLIYYKESVAYTRRLNNKNVHLLHNPVHHWFIKEKCGHVIKHGCQLKIIFSTPSYIADLISYQTGSVWSCAAQLHTLYTIWPDICSMSFNVRSCLFGQRVTVGRWPNINFPYPLHWIVAMASEIIYLSCIIGCKMNFHYPFRPSA